MAAIQKILSSQKKFFNSGHTQDIGYRIEALKTLQKAIIENEKNILAALKSDLSKSAYESYMTEVGIILDEIRFVSKQLKSWAKPKKVKTPFIHFPSSSYIYPEPYGVCLIISPWNYPFQLALAPLIGAISAGNCCVLKPSEYAPNTAQVIAETLNAIFEKKYIAVVEDDSHISTALLRESFDYIFFTGSVAVGKIVMAAAANNLTPVTLELGGKSPCIVDHDVNIKLAAKRIVMGKFINAGQTCIAPDYLLVHKTNKPKVIDQINQHLREFYGNDPQESPDYGRIINNRHFERLVGLLQKGDIIVGGKTDQKDLFISPTLIENISWDDPIMQDEIFGPILPVLEYEELSEVIATINTHPKPLALYIFSSDPKNYRKIIKEISFGGGCINDTLVHFANPYLPFGGIGNSGMGSYHGKASFGTFSHQKSVLKKSFLVDIPLRYPPYKNKLGILKKVMK